MALVPRKQVIFDKTRRDVIVPPEVTLESLCQPNWYFHCTIAFLHIHKCIFLKSIKHFKKYFTLCEVFALAESADWETVGLLFF